MRKFLIVLFIFSLTVPSRAEEQPADSGIVGSFWNYLELLDATHPGIKELEESANAAKELPDFAHSLKDPMVSLQMMNVSADTLKFESEGMTKKQFGISQSFPAYGKRGLRKAVAEDNVKIAEFKIPEKREELYKEAWIVFLKLDFLLKAKESVIQNKRILNGFLKIALSKYLVGRGLQENVLHAEVMISNMEARLLELEEDIGSVKAVLAVMASMPNENGLADIKIPKIKKESGTLDTFTDMAVDNRPIFKMLKSNIEKFEHKTKLARKDLLPDYKLGVAYGQRDDLGAINRSDLVSASLTFSVPLWQSSRQQKKIASTKFLKSKAISQYEKAKQTSRKKIGVLIEKEKGRDKLLTLYDEGLLLQAEQTVEASLAAYRVNKIDFLTLVTNQVELLDYQIKRDMAEFELQKARVELKREIGDKLKEVAEDAR